MEFPGEKVVIKLWETLTEKGVGSLLTPWQIVREGTARNKVRREELLMLAQAEVDAAEIPSGRKYLEQDVTLRLSSQQPSAESAAGPEAGERAAPTMNVRSLAAHAYRFGVAEEMRKEINVSKAVIYAEEVLANDQQVPPERSIEEDWLFAWRDCAGRVSVEDLQRLWGKVLAGEVKSPGKFCLRTLEFLKGLSKDEAEQISELARFVMHGNILRSLPDYLGNPESTQLLLTMEELGLVSEVQGLGLTVTYLSASSDRFQRLLLSNGKILVVEHDDPNKQLLLQVYHLTTVAKELLSLGSFQPNLDYLRLAGKEIVKQGFAVQLADWEQVTADKIRYFNAEAIDA